MQIDGCEVTEIELIRVKAPVDRFAEVKQRLEAEGYRLTLHRELPGRELCEVGGERIKP